MRLSIIRGRGLGRCLRALALAIGLAIPALLAHTLKQQYDRAVAEAELRAANTARALEQHAARTFETVDAYLQAVASLVGPHMDHLRRETVHTALREQFLRTHLNNIMVVDRDGVALVEAAEFPARPLDVRDRDYFQTLRDRPGRGLVVGRPIVGRLTGRLVLPVARRIDGPDGAFAGLVQAMLDPRAFQAVYDAIDNGPGATLNLWRTDGTLLVRSPRRPEVIGRSFAAGEDYRLHVPVRDTRPFWSATGTDEVRRAIAFGFLDGYPLYVSASLGRDDALAGWRGSAAAQAALAGGLTLVLVAALLLLARETERRQRADALIRAGEARYRAATAAAQDAILAQLAEGVIVTDAMGRITLVNAAAAAIHGVARLDVEPDAYSDTYRLFTEDGRPHPPLDLPLARAVRGETVREARWRIRRPDGAEVLAIGNAQPLLGPDGERIGAVLTVRDDTARDAAESALRDLNATLSQRVAERTREVEAARVLAEAGSRAKSEFLAAMSHEIRTPLHGVIGYGDLLCDEPGLGPRARQYAERIRGAGAALLAVVDDVLDFSKIEAGQVAIAPLPFALDALIEDAISLVRGLAAGKGLALTVAPGAGLPGRVVGDRDRLRQVLLNLLNNAVKFTHAGGVTLAVDAQAAEGGSSRLRFSVSDTGIGVPADKRDRLFRRFSQVDGSISRDYGGTGLGLAISKALVERMGGTIGVESEPGQGSTFWFALDLPVDLPTAAEAVGAGAAPAAAGPQAGRRLLLAEDVPLNQELARAILERAGHRVDVVGDGAAAVAAVQAVAYDLVLMDVQMPILDGLAATRRIRALPGPAGRVPVVALTANVLPEQVAEFLAAGMVDHVGKPFRRDGLLDAIDRWTAGGAAPRPRGRAVDRAALDALGEAVGPARLGGLLAGLAEELEARFGRDAPAPDRERLAHDAHATVSAAAMLGFPGLAQACREVEAACRAGEDCTARVAALRALTAETVAEIAVLRAA